MCAVMIEHSSGASAANGASSTRLEPRAIVAHVRQRQVTVERGVTVPRESACRRRPRPPPAGRARTPRPWRATRSGSAPKLRSPITGLSGLVSTSSTGAKSMLKPSAASWSPRARASRLGQAGVVDAAERAHRRQLQHRRPEPLHPAALLVDRDPRAADRAGNACGQRAGQPGHLVRGAQIAAKQDEPAQLALPGGREQLGRRRGSLKTGDERLTCQLADRVGYHDRCLGDGGPRPRPDPVPKHTSSGILAILESFAAALTRFV